MAGASTALPAASSLPGCWLRSLRFSWALLLLLAGMLGGCESDNPWAPYTDRVLRVATFMSCFDGISGLPPNGTFYQVLSPQLVADERGVGRLRYYDGRTIRDEAVHFVWRRSWSEGSAPPPDNNVRCAAVWDIPWSTRLNRPYYLEDEPARVAKRYGPLVKWHDLILCGMTMVLLIGTILSWFSYDADEYYQFAFVVAGALGACVASTIIGDISVRQPWKLVERALDYYAFYDALPKRSGLLQPLSAAAIDRLLQAPPLPSQIGFSIDVFAWTAGLLGLSWLGFNAHRIVIGAYWIFVPLPLEQQHARVLASGDIPTTDELLQALSDTLVGKSPWQLDVMRRKAKAFRRQLEPHTQQGG